MKRIAFLLMVAAVCAVAAEPDFAGNWMLNTAKSEYGQFPAPDVMMRTIAQQPGSIRMSTFQKGAQGEVNSELRYSTDGKPSVNGDNTGTARWEGAKLVIDVSRTVANQGKSNELKSREEWSLSGDGKTLTVTTHIELPQQGGFDVKQVFERMPGVSGARANF
jgi:hypothetical protein